MTGERTLTDADIAALVAALKAPRKAVVRRLPPADRAIVPPQVPDGAAYRQSLRVNNSNVSPSNAGEQALPLPMVSALLTARGRNRETKPPC